MKMPAALLDILEPEAETHGVTIDRRQVDGGCVCKAVVAEHDVAGLGHELHGLAELDTRHAVA